MPLVICPNCQTRHQVASTQDDFICECHSGDTTLDQEDVPVIGDWEDFTGSAVIADSFTQVVGTANEFKGTRVKIEDPTANISDFTDRGKRADTHRQRQHLEYIRIRDSC